MNHKYYKFENCPGVLWRQKELTYPEFETILNNVHAFIRSLNVEEELTDALHRFLKQSLPDAIRTLVRPYAPTWYQRLWNWILVMVKCIDPKDPIRYMTLSESAGVVNDFFFLNLQWTKNLSGSVENLGMTVQETLKAVTGMMISQSVGAKSSISLQKEEQTKPND